VEKGSRDTGCPPPDWIKFEMPRDLEKEGPDRYRPGLLLSS
jgi:hypothetical protein